MAAHIAFLSSDHLRRNSEQLVANIDARSKAPQADLMIRIMSDFTDEVLQVFFIDVIDLLQLSHFMQKVIHGSVNTIKGTINSISRTIIHKLDNQQIIPMADYMGSLMLTAPDTSGDNRAWVGFPVSERMIDRLDTLIGNIRHGNPQEHVQELSSVLNEITDLAMAAYFTMPIELLKLGFILRKMADGGVSVIRGAVHIVIRKLVPDLSNEQLLAVANYMDTLILRNGSAYR